jgi:hypothetical protein
MTKGIRNWLLPNYGPSGQYRTLADQQDTIRKRCTVSAIYTGKGEFTIMPLHPTNSTCRVDSGFPGVLMPNQQRTHREYEGDKPTPTKEQRPLRQYEQSRTERLQER